MKTLCKLLNSLDRVQTNTLREKMVKDAGLRIMWDAIKANGDDKFIHYVVGKGYKPTYKPKKITA